MHIWTTLCGRSVRFDAVPLGLSVPSISGVYCYVRAIYVPVQENPWDSWVHLYIGKSNDLRRRQCEHRGDIDKLLLGQTHLLIAHVPLEDDRTAIERDMIDALQPAANVHYAERSRALGFPTPPPILGGSGPSFERVRNLMASLEHHPLMAMAQTGKSGK